MLHHYLYSVQYTGNGVTLQEYKLYNSINLYLAPPFFCATFVIRFISTLQYIIIFFFYSQLSF